MLTRCLILLCTCLASNLLSQTFSAFPDPLYQGELQFHQANECAIFFDNPGGDSLQLHWRLIESNLPEGWDADLCDYGWCYSGIPSNGLMNTVFDTVRPYLKLVVQPGDVSGATWIWFRVYEEGNEGNFVDVFFSLHTPGTLGAPTPNEPALRAYPNPASDILWIENNAPYSIASRLSNAAGQVVWQRTIPAYSREQVGVVEWPAGLYLLKNANQTQKILVK